MLLRAAVGTAVGTGVVGEGVVGAVVGLVGERVVGEVVGAAVVGAVVVGAVVAGQGAVVDPVAQVVPKPPAKRRARPDSYRVSFWSKDEIPRLESVTEPEKEFLVKLIGRLSAWNQAGAVKIQFLFLLPAEFDKGLGMAAIKRLLGETYWKRLYGDKVVVAEDYVPLQMQAVLPEALRKADEDLKAGDALNLKVVEDQRKEAEEMLVDIVKKRKLEPAEDEEHEDYNTL